MTYSLYPDQIDLIERTRDSMRRNKRVLVRAQTGSGKTVISAEMISKSREKGKRCIFIVPRRELLKQTAKTFKSFGIPFGYIAAGYDMNPHAQTILATAGTLYRRLDKLQATDIAVIDEAHYGGEQLDQIAQHFINQGSWLVGLTATPKPGMDHIYQDVVAGPNLRWLMDNGRLSDYRLFQPSSPDLSAIKTVAGEYHQGQLSEMMEEDKVLIGDAVRQYRNNAMGKLNIAYCTSIKHSQITAQAFRDGGVPAASLDGSMGDDEIKRIIVGFAKREINVITNCSLLDMGFDLESASGLKVTIECMSDLAPTMSIIRQSQKWGRVLRMKDEPAIISDHAGNAIKRDGTPNHGLPCEERDWPITKVDKRNGGGDRALPVKQCSKCFYCHRPAPKCPNCGHIYEVKSRMIDEVEGELIEIDKSLVKKKKIDEQRSAETFGELVALGKSRGYKNPQFWAKKIIEARR